MITILNKVDQCTQKASISRLRAKLAHTVQVSALNRSGFDDLFVIMQKFLEGTTQTNQYRIPQKDYRIFSEILQQGRVLEHEYQENDILVTATCPLELASKLKSFQV